MTTPHLKAPSEELVVDQLDRTFGGADHFTFDVARPYSDNEQMWDVFGEVVDEDIYNLRNFTQRGDVWVDAGCHVGLFSIAAMMAGADVSVMYDMDPKMAWCAEANVRSFLMQQIIRDLRPRIRTVGSVQNLNRPDPLVSAAIQTKEAWQDFGKRACLKLDIQGAEQKVLALDGPKKLAEEFDMMVLEWHFPDDLKWLTDGLEKGGWKIKSVKQHEDILLNSVTNIVWAVSG